jgi:hypothetical protein
MGDMIHIIGGGTFSHVRNHMALAAPAFGGTANRLLDIIEEHLQTLPDYRSSNLVYSDRLELHLTKMADPSSTLVTNNDVEALLDKLIADPNTRVIVMSAALCDYDGEVEHYHGTPKVTSGPHAKRLKTSEGRKIMFITPAQKLIGKIRKERKDIFVVGFKTTTDETSDNQYRIALDMLKRDSLNLVLANDTVTRNNMIVAPEETRYYETTDRNTVLEGLAQMILARSTNTFTRSTVVDGPAVAWQSPLIPDNLREVVDHCIAQGAYKPFRGVTAGHFAVKIDDGTILTSKRKRNFNNLAEEGLVKVEYEGDEKVIAHGAKPSVGGQSQRVVFREHPEMDCIVHFHSPLKKGVFGFPTADQWPHECGSLQCGQNTSSHLKTMGNHAIMAVMLDSHGPNIVFSKTTPAADVIEFIDQHFDLSAKTGGLVA